MDTVTFVQKEAKPLPRYAAAWERAAHAIGEMAVEVSDAETFNAARTSLLLAETLWATRSEGFLVRAQDLLSSLLNVLEGGDGREIWRARAIYRAAEHTLRIPLRTVFENTAEMTSLFNRLARHPYDSDVYVDDLPFEETFDAGERVSKAMEAWSEDDDADPLVTDAISAWLTRLDDMATLPPLIQAARAIRALSLDPAFGALAQPFAKLTIPLILGARGSLPAPCLFVSPEFTASREAWMDVADLPEDMWTEKFMSICEQAAKRSVKMLRTIKLLKTNWKNAAQIRRSTSRLPEAIDIVLEHPVITTEEFRLRLDVTRTSSIDIARRLMDAGILAEITGRKRDRVFASIPLLSMQERLPK